MDVTYTQKDLLDLGKGARFWSHKLRLMSLALICKTGILKAIKKSAYAVKRVVITSSTAAILDPYDIASRKISEVSTSL